MVHVQRTGQCSLQMWKICNSKSGTSLFHFCRAWHPSYQSKLLIDATIRGTVQNIQVVLIGYIRQYSSGQINIKFERVLLRKTIFEPTI